MGAVHFRRAFVRLRKREEPFDEVCGDRANQDLPVSGTHFQALGFVDGPAKRLAVFALDNHRAGADAAAQLDFHAGPCRSTRYCVLTCQRGIDRHDRIVFVRVTHAEERGEAFCRRFDDPATEWRHGLRERLVRAFDQFDPVLGLVHCIVGQGEVAIDYGDLPPLASGHCSLLPGYRCLVRRWALDMSASLLDLGDYVREKGLPPAIVGIALPVRQIGRMGHLEDDRQIAW